jgi:hypothetical protein
MYIHYIREKIPHLFDWPKLKAFVNHSFFSLFALGNPRGGRDLYKNQLASHNNILRYGLESGPVEAGRESARVQRLFLQSPLELDCPLFTECSPTQFEHIV